MKNISTYQWFCRLLCTISNIKFYNAPIVENCFPRLPEEAEDNAMYNLISEWIKRMIKCKPGEIEDRTTNQINNKNSIEKEPVYYNADESPHSI